MKKKNVFLIIIIAIILVALVVFGYYQLKDSNFKYYNLNQEKLNEDIKSIKENGTIINAKLTYNESNASASYEGEGYVINEIPGGDCIEYVIYHNGKVIWEYVKVFSMTD